MRYMKDLVADEEMKLLDKVYKFFSTQVYIGQQYLIFYNTQFCSI